MSATENTKTHRNQQRRARALAKAGGISYQAALEQVRSEDPGQESTQARVPAMTERRGWSTGLGDGEPRLMPLLFTEHEGQDEYAPRLREELLRASTDGVLERKRLVHEINRRLQALETDDSTHSGRLRSFQEKWLPELGDVWAWDGASDAVLVSMLADLMVNECFGPFEGAEPDPFEDLVDELRDLDRDVLIAELSKRMERLEKDDPKGVREFEREWAFALSAIESGGEGNLADDELEKMVAGLRLMREVEAPGVSSEDQEDGPEAPCIKKVYFYGDRRGNSPPNAGEDEINLADFVGFHIQDDEVGLRCAEDLLRDGESNNDDEHEMVHESYTIIDRSELIRQVRLFLDKAQEDEEIEFEFDAALLAG